VATRSVDVGRPALLAAASAVRRAVTAVSESSGCSRAGPAARGTDGPPAAHAAALRQCSLSLSLARAARPRTPRRCGTGFSASESRLGGLETVNSTWKVLRVHYTVQ
jgi:hypothetical protein